MLELKNISNQIGDFTLKDVNLEVEMGDYYILLGVSGAGKSMILETIAGLVAPRSGSIFLEGENITKKKIQERSIGIVFQDHAVFPHMTVYQNIAYSLHKRNLSNEEKDAKIQSIARQMDILSFLHRQPGTLSGGELQRVALARTLVQEPKILLLDEPLASMDVQLKSELRSLLRQLNRNGQTIIHVSHNYEEAVSLGNKIAVIHNGTALQQGKIDEVLQNPISEFVAHFTGAKNFYSVKHLKGDDINIYTLSNHLKIAVDQTLDADNGFIMLKNEDIFLSADKNPSQNSLQGEITELVKLPCGMEAVINVGVLIYVTLNPIVINNLKLEEGSKVWVNFSSSAVRFLHCKSS